MEKNNCLRCNFRHTDNGNCTAVGGFCTAVTAVHCPLLRDFLDTGLTPDEIRNMSGEWCAAMSVLNGMGSYDRLRELADADKDGRVVVLPCKVGDTVYFVNAKQILEFAVVGYAVDETGISWVYSEHVDKTGHTNERKFSPDRFGKNTFLTREEAERALQEMEDKA